MKNGSFANVSILCVDNYVDSLALLKVCLELEGAVVYTAVSAQEAERVFAKHHPSILICDLALPERDGMSLLKSIRKQDPNVPAIALTGISDPGVRQQALESGFERYLVKPVDEDVLIKAVSSLVTKSTKRPA
jgi:CheY-like chemotaxis protein